MGRKAQLKDTQGRNAYPVTKDKCVEMSDGSGNLKDYLNKRVTELNISALYPTNGEGGTNKYTLEGAIAQVPAEYRSIVGLKITFVNNETSKPETWVYNGSTFTAAENWVRSNDNEKLEELEANMLPPIKGKNLFNYNDSRTYFIDKYINNRGEILDFEGFITIIIDVKSLTNYSITGSRADWNICFFNDTQFISYINDNYSRKFTTPENCNIVKMSSQKFSNSIFGIVINEGDKIDENSKYWETYITPSQLKASQDSIRSELQEITNEIDGFHPVLVSERIIFANAILSNTELDKNTGVFVDKQGKQAVSINTKNNNILRFEGLRTDISWYYVLVKNGEAQLPAITIPNRSGNFNNIDIICEGYDEVRMGAQWSDTVTNFTGGAFLLKKAANNLLETKVDKIYGKNIFDVNRNDNVPGLCNNGIGIEPGFGSIGEDGKLQGFFTSYYMEVKPNTTYSASFVIGDNSSKVFLYSKDKTLIRTISNNVKSFTTSETEVLARMSCRFNESISIEEGDTATPGTPHENYKLLSKQEYDNLISKSNQLDQFLQDVKIVNHLTDWKGLNIAGYGNSITYGQQQSSDGVLTSGWLKTVGDYFGFDKRYNRGIGGTTVMDHRHDETTEKFLNPSGYYGIEEGVTEDMRTTCKQAMSTWERIKAQFPESIKDTIDIILFKGGTNDFALNPSDIGDGLLPKWSTGNTYDTEWIADTKYNPEGGDFDTKTSFKGAVASTILKLQRWMPYARIVVVTQLSGRRETKEDGMTDFCYDKNGKTPLDYANDAIMVAQMMSVNYIDVFGTCGINQFNSKLFIQDTVHPWDLNTTLPDGNIARNGSSQLARAVIGGIKNILPISRTYSDADTYE